MRKLQVTELTAITDPSGESSQWGDSHIRAAALYVQRVADKKQYRPFYGGQE
jgi:hypothetical protein